MGVFKIQDQDTKKQIVETHYYEWLLSKKRTDIHKSLTKVDYLKEQGFQIGIDYITDAEINTLKYIEHHYFRKVIKPILNELIKEIC